MLENLLKIEKKSLIRINRYGISNFRWIVRAFIHPKKNCLIKSKKNEKNKCLPCLMAITMVNRLKRHSCVKKINGKEQKAEIVKRIINNNLRCEGCFKNGFLNRQCLRGHQATCKGHQQLKAKERLYFEKRHSIHELQ